MGRLMPFPRVAITNGRVVLPERIVQAGTLVASGGFIEAVDEVTSASLSGIDLVLDADGAYVLPGLVDLHNDALELEVNPRPGANLPLPFALGNLERRLAAAGVTTEFHAIAFMDRPKNNRTVSAAVERAAYLTVAASEEHAVDHHVLHRIDVWHADSLDSVFDSLAAARVPYASLNDHTPGQGQYRDISKLIEYNRAVRPESDTVIEQELRDRIAERAADTTSIPLVYGRVRQERQVCPFVLSTHDDDRVEKVDAQVALGATVAEFPVTLDAAARARELGMAIVVGAPNIIRGGSSSGNLAAVELIQRNLADVICADYHAPSLLPAVFKLVHDGLLDLPTGMRMLTLNAARAVGLLDRGSLSPGLRADLVVARVDKAGLPHVEATVRGGRPTFLYGRLASVRSRATVAA
jgi:alpha-D-ribose 1-methylphosphonate 5-triphosphate diphosphatase